MKMRRLQVATIAKALGICWARGYQVLVGTWPST
jgi:hypothetical protein